jgi:hypothetical protein
LSSPHLQLFEALELVLSQSLIFGQNPKIGCQEFNLWGSDSPKLASLSRRMVLSLV